MKILLRLVINAFVIFLIPYIVPGFTVSSLVTAIVVALILGIINVTLKPILLLLTLPINILTLGLFTFVINALMLMLVDLFVQTFKIENFFTALIAALVIAVIHFIINRAGVTK